MLPMPPLVIDRIHSKAQGQPAQPIFANRHGKPIDNFPPTFDDNPTVTQTINDELPGVMFPESEESAKIPGVDGNQDYMDYMPEPDLDVKHDGNQDSMPEPDLDLRHNNLILTVPYLMRWWMQQAWIQSMYPSHPQLQQGCGYPLGSVTSQRIINLV